MHGTREVHIKYYKERDHSLNPDIDRKTTLNSSFKKYGVRVLAGFRWLTMEPRAWLLYHGNEPSGLRRMR